MSPVASPSVPGTDTFYRDFEDQHRGSRELIKQRLRVYLPFIRPLAVLYPTLPVLDVGCGRGEWLELLCEQAMAAHGVDTDEGMLAACRERGLSVTHGDAIKHLASLDSHSLLAVTGFHIAEHLPFDVLQALLAQARRVLVPGGLLVLETPNPENLLVGAANFYIDPTHQRPLPSQLLVFLAEHQGLAPVKLLRLQEEPRLAQNGPVGLYDVLANVSPDYAIVAQAPQAPAAPFVNDAPSAAPSQAELAAARQLAQAFARDAGVSLHTLASRYDEQAQAQAEQLSTQVQQLSARAEQHSTQVQQLSQQLSQQVSQLRTEVEQISQQARQSAAELAAVYASRSWRITAPLRRLIQRFRGGPGPG